MKAPAGAFVLAVLCGAGCVSTSAEPERVSVLAPAPPDVRSVVIQALPMKAGSMKNVEGVTNAPQLFAQRLKEALKVRQPSWQIDVTDSTGSAPAGDLVIVTELLEVDGGSAGSRFWIGFGAGKARSSATVSIRDREGKDLATASISEITTCPIGGCTESNEVMVQTNLKDLGEEAAAFVANPVEFRQRAKSESK
jgi:hypothetical protein